MLFFISLNLSLLKSSIIELLLWWLVSYQDDFSKAFLGFLTSYKSVATQISHDFVLIVNYTCV